jgi:soluble lytic murein transglycosylase
MSDRELLAAADFACQREVWDRCINTSERTKTVIDVASAFPCRFATRWSSAPRASGWTRPMCTA